MPETSSAQTAAAGADPGVRLAQVCQELAAGADMESLLAAVQAELPDLSVQHVMTRAGWHRLGGVVDLDGNRITHNLAEWAESESGGDIDELLFKLSDVQYLVVSLIFLDGQPF